MFINRHQELAAFARMFQSDTAEPFRSIRQKTGLGKLNS